MSLPVLPRHALLAAAGALAVSTAAAQSVFTTTAGSPAWADPANWSDGIPDGIGASAVFNTPAGAQSIPLGANRTLGSISLTNNSNGGIVFATGQTLTFEVASGNAAITVNGTGNAVNRIVGPSVLNSDIVVTVNNTNVTDNRGAFAFFGAVSGSGRLIKEGEGTLSVAGSTYSFTGGVSILGAPTASPAPADSAPPPKPSWPTRSSSTAGACSITAQRASPHPPTAASRWAAAGRKSPSPAQAP